jgi:transcription antitermination factor NusG
MGWDDVDTVWGRVRITDGPFADLVEKLEHLDAAARVRVLLDLLGRSVSVALRREVLMAAL